jgi:hypothetical protein
LQSRRWQRLVSDCFFSYCSATLQKRTMMTTIGWVHHCFFLCCSAVPWKGRGYAPIALSFFFVAAM